MSMHRTYPHISGIIPQLWSLLSPTEEELLQIYSVYESCPRDHIFYHFGKDPDHCYVLIQGKVKIVLDAVDGMHRVVHLICPSRLFGYRTFFSDFSPSAEAIAMEDCLVYSIPLSVLDELCSLNAEVAKWLLRDCCSDMMFNDIRFVALMSKQSRGRLADALFYIKNVFGMDADGCLKVQLSRRTLGEISNLSVSNVSRLLSAFQKEGLLRVEGRSIRLLHGEGLITVSRMG